MTALLAYLPKGKNPAFPYVERPYRPTWEIILSLHKKAATGVFFAHFKP